ncbi:hypothetical protein H4Q26_012811 [Puccinia striiformis f. sp. tritici PST-130]|nr:hypothetical protein H4Q26_012811 [Puccinia striiformis f. sp. tritici PST-130]
MSSTTPPIFGSSSPFRLKKSVAGRESSITRSIRHRTANSTPPLRLCLELYWSEASSLLRRSKEPPSGSDTFCVRSFDTYIIMTFGRQSSGPAAIACHLSTFLIGIPKSYTST